MKERSHRVRVFGLCPRPPNKSCYVGKAPDSGRYRCSAEVVGLGLILLQKFQEGVWEWHRSDHGSNPFSLDC
jgi:hypothetical protein